MGISQPFDAREPSGRGLFAFVVAATHNRYTLTVDVIERRSFFTLGNWNALTRLKWRVQRENNSVIREGVSVGENHRSNMLGYATAKAVSQDAFDSANGILRKLDLFGSELDCAGAEILPSQPQAVHSSKL